MHRNTLAVIGLTLIAASAAGCSDDETTPGPATTSAAGGNGAGGAGSGGALQGGGGSGGGSSSCLASSSHADAFTFEADGLCVVARYEAPFAVASYAPPTWGRHSGPMTLVQGFAGADPADEITLTRWAIEGEALATMETIGPLTVGASAMPYFASIATDLPGTPWTLVAYADATFAGELVALDGSTIADRWSVNGYYWGAAVGSDTPRLLYTSQGALEDAAGATAGLYAADFCAGPSLCDDGASAVDSWGNATGPVAADGDGNVFAIQTDFVAGDQTLRGYAASAVAAGAPPVAGTDLLTQPGFGSSLAALPPSGGDDGWVLFQPQTFEGGAVVSGDVVAVRFKVDGASLNAETSAAPAIVLKTPGAEVTLMSDDQERIWLGMATGDATSTFYLLARRD